MSRAVWWLERRIQPVFLLRLDLIRACRDTIFIRFLWRADSIHGIIGNEREGRPTFMYYLYYFYLWLFLVRRYKAYLRHTL